MVENNLSGTFNSDISTGGSPREGKKRFFHKHTIGWVTSKQNNFRKQELIDKTKRNRSNQQMRFLQFYNL